MRKLVLLTLTLLFLLALTSVALAAGWHTIGPLTHDPDAGYWNVGMEPHRGLQTSSNNCKVCHAAHDANSNSFKLLRDNSRATECDYCHDATSGVTSKKPYSVTDPYGEHSLNGNTMKDPLDSAKYYIPESSAAVRAANSIKTDGLSCGNCHSVHDAWTINDPLAGSLASKILRRDPANNGDDALTGIMSVDDYALGSPPALGPTGAIDEKEILAAFCGDCHNKNVNWDRGPATPGSPPSDEGERPNGHAHILGKGVDGYIDIYGQLKLVEDSTDANVKAATCTSCHRSVAADRFPHQSRSHKFLGSYDGTSVIEYRDTSPIPSFNYTGDPYRVLPKLDGKVCRTCHANVGKPADSTSF